MFEWECCYLLISAKEPLPIKVTLPDGKVVEGQSWRTTPYDVASSIRFVTKRERECR